MENELTLTRLIKASPETLFRCWTEPKLLVKMGFEQSWGQCADQLTALAESL